MPTRYSHPPEDGREGVHLHDHLDDVARRVDYVVPADATTPGGDSLRPVVRTLAHVHDFGKATTFFQEYLDGVDPPSPTYRHHAPIGAFAAYHALSTQGFDTETCLAGFVAVAKHHGELPDVAEYVYERSHRREGVERREQNAAERRQSIIVRQIRDIDEHVPDLAEQVFHEATAGRDAWASFRDGFAELLGEIEATVGTTGRAPGVNRAALSESCYALVLDCWSSLVLADKTSAAGVRNDPDAYAADPPSTDRLARHVRRLETESRADPEGSRLERLNHHRSRARRAVLDNTKAFAAGGGGVATLTLPTGMGKTLTGLSAAFDVRDRLDGKRVVYALPFTSIIDQVVDEVADIYETDAAGRLLTAHHHLAETTIHDDSADSDAADQADDIGGMLAESWRAGLTVTTFVQLFESLAGPANRQSMKLPALRDSVVVLDEPQSLPLDWWKLVPRLVELLTEQYGATVIAMTATQPRLFDGATPLVDDPDSYFDAVTRVTYELDPSTERYLSDRSDPKPYDDAAMELRSSIDAGESALAICNTIDSARQLTDRVTALDPEAVSVADAYATELDARGDTDGIDPATVADRVVAAGDRAILHLSTRLRPADRLALIHTAKELTRRGHGLLTVSTQLVEAGVDISFDRVYRDLAPIDNVVQAAGRCNRSFERDRGRVTVWWLDVPDDQSKTPAEAVYGRLLAVTANTLESVREDRQLSEIAVARTAVERYYRRLDEDRNVGEQRYVDYVDNAKADELGSLSLIDQQRSVEIFVVRTDDEWSVAEAVREASQAYDFDQLRQLLDETKPLRISVPLYRHDEETAEAVGELPQLVGEEGIYLLDARQHGPHFDDTTGFVVPDSSVEARIL